MGELFQARALRALMGSAAAVACVAFAVPAMAQTRSFDVSAQSAAKGIPAFARQAGIQLLAPAREMRGKRTNAVKGSYPVDQALRMLLQGTGLEASRDPGTGITTIRAAAQAQTTSSRGRSDATRTASTAGKASPGTVEARTASSSGEDGAGRTPTGSEPGEEIVVTAQKREERLRDVPVPVTVLNADNLATQNLVKLQDYYSRIPGLSLSPAVQSVQILSIRGISTGSGNPTVGVMVDDVPYGASTSFGGGNRVPDIDPGDLARIEVLRGPQGTLYGASSMGGLLKFVTREPSTASVSGRIQAGVSTTRGGDSLGYSLRGSVNVPLTDNLAVRASGFHRIDPGYIDNVQTGEKDVNRTNADGFRLAGLWRVTDSFKVNLSALVQNVSAPGSSEIDRLPGVSGLQQSILPGVGGFDRSSQAYSAIIDGDLGGVKLTSLTGWNIYAFTDSFDYTYLLGGSSQGLFGVRGTGVFNENRSEKLTQEVRAVVPFGDKLELLAGGYFTDEKSTFVQNAYGINPSGLRVGRLLFLTFPTTYKEIAGFADLTYRFSDKFDIQIGARKSFIDQTYTQTQIFGNGAPAIVPELKAESDAFTYLLTPRFRITPNLIAYIRLASGYRVGGFNANASPTIPATFRPDKTQNYELGVKGDVVPDLLSVDLSIYRIDWKDIQIRTINPLTGVSFNSNGSRARSQGIEFTAEVRPSAGLTISGWGAYSDAKLTENFPVPSPVVALKGDRLPLSSKFSANLTIDQKFELGSSVSASVGGTLSYRTSSRGPFIATAAREVFPSYTNIDLYANIQFDKVSAALFVNNITDSRGVLAGGAGNIPPYGYYYTQPRTVGLSLTILF